MTPQETVRWAKSSLKAEGLRTHYLLQNFSDNPEEWSESQINEVAHCLGMYCREVWSTRNELLKLAGKDPDDYE